MSRTRRPGPHELGQNFLTDRRTIARIVRLAGQTSGPLVEWGTGDGSVTVPLSRLGRPLEGVEIDAVRARNLRRRVGPHVCISEGDILRHAPPAGSTVVSNVPFSLTTPVLRHLLSSPGWVRAVLLVQWEVAKKRAGVGGTTQLTAQWWPWLSFTLDRGFPPRLSTLVRRWTAGSSWSTGANVPCWPPGSGAGYQRWVRQVFTGGGRGLPDILARTGRLTRAAGQAVLP